MPKPLLTVLIALAAAALLGAVSGREPFVPRLVRLEVAATLPEMAGLLADESIAVNAVMLEYARDPTLRLNAHLALRRYPEMTREILPLYGGEPEFRAVLADHGPAVMPPIAYFMRHEIGSLQLMRAAAEALAAAKAAAQRVVGGGDDAGPAPVEVPATADLTPVERGWFAVAFIRDEGHDFLGQFTVDAHGEVAWIQTERFTEAATAFFTSGIRGLEMRYRLDEVPGAGDYLWAGVDVALVVGAAKVLRAGRAAGAGSGAAAASARASLAGRAAVRAGRSALRVGRYGVPLAVAYAVVRHPSLISGLAAQAANLVGWPVPLVQGVAWFVVLLPVLLLVRTVLRWLVRPVLGGLRAAIRGVLWFEHSTRPRRRVRPEREPESDERIEPRLGDLSRAADVAVPPDVLRR